MDQYSIQNYPDFDFEGELEAKGFVLRPARLADIYTFEDGKMRKAMSSDRRCIHLSGWPECGVCDIKVGPLEFQVFVDCQNAVLHPRLMSMARDAMRHIVALDLKARSVSASHNLEESISYVFVRREDVELHYVAGNVNAEWGAYFEQAEDGRWKYKYLG